MSRYETIEILPEDEDGAAFGSDPEKTPVERALERRDKESRERYYEQFKRTPKEERDRERAWKEEDDQYFYDNFCGR